MKIIQTKINDLKPYKNNPRKHTEEQIAQIAKSIDEFGFLNPILFTHPLLVYLNVFKICLIRPLRFSMVQLPVTEIVFDVLI